ncbi:MAG: InlB B-repeat-containing protein, partial [Oscillospiraceae bacterium]
DDDMGMFVPVLVSNKEIPAKHVNFSSNGSKSVTFDARNGGTPIPAVKIDKDTGKIAALPDAPTWPDYTFGGWYTKIDGAGTEVTADTTY